MGIRPRDSTTGGPALPIILGAVAGEQNVAIAEKLGVSRPTVLLWRKRVREQGIGEVWQIASRTWAQAAVRSGHARADHPSDLAE